MDEYREDLRQERKSKKDDSDDLSVEVFRLRHMIDEMNDSKAYRRLSRYFPMVKSDKFQNLLEELENVEEMKRLLVERDELDFNNTVDPYMGEKSELLASAITSMLNCIIAIVQASCNKHIDPSKEKEANAKIDKAMEEFHDKNDEVNRRCEEIDKKLQEINRQKQQQVPRRSQGYSMER